MSVRLFVGNLPYDATEEEIREHFSSVGTVSFVVIPLDRETGKKRGFAFVEYDDPEEAQEAIRQFNNQPFNGRPLAVNEARAREGRPAPAGGGFRPAGGPKPSAPGRGSERGGFASDSGLIDTPRSDRPNRKFGPDSKPARARSQRFLKPVGTKKAFKEKFTGQFFGVDDGEDSGGNPDIDDFATGLDSIEKK